MIEQAAKCKAEGNAHFTAQRNAAAVEAYKEGIATLPARKVAVNKSTNDSSGKGKGRQDPESDEEAQDSATEKAKNDSQLREIVDDEDEQAFIEEGKMSDEEKQVIELRGALWNNLAACQLRLVRQHAVHELLTMN